MTYLDWLTHPWTVVTGLFVIGTVLIVFAGKIARFRRSLVPDMTLREAADYVSDKTPQGRGQATEFVLNRIQEKAADDFLRVWGGDHEKVIAPERYKSERHAFVFSGVGDWFCLVGGPISDHYFTEEAGKAISRKADSWISPKLCRWQVKSVFPQYSIFSRLLFATLKKFHYILDIPKS